MKENYFPWHVRVEDFPRDRDLREQLLFLLRFAILAPSGHNSQPWEFSIGGNTIKIFANKERSLAQSDPDRRQLMVSIGCALENLLLAADYYGFKVGVDYLPEGEKQDLISRIIIEKAGERKNDDQHLIFSIPHRCTNRNKYRDQLLPQDFLVRIKSLSTNNLIVTVVTEKKLKDAVADVVNIAQIEAMEDDLFREELSHYVKSNLTMAKTGMPGFTLGMPLPISLIASRLIKKVNMSKKTMKKDDELLKLYTPVFILVSAVSDDNVSRVKAGQILERIWLMATKEGLSCAPLAAGVQVGEYYKNLQKILGLSSRPQAFLRMGYCGKSVRHSPRFYVEEVLKVN